MMLCCVRSYFSETSTKTNSVVLNHVFCFIVGISIKFLVNSCVILCYIDEFIARACTFLRLIFFSLPIFYCCCRMAGFKEGSSFGMCLRSKVSGDATKVGYLLTLFVKFA